MILDGAINDIKMIWVGSLVVGLISRPGAKYVTLCVFIGSLAVGYRDGSFSQQGCLHFSTGCWVQALWYSLLPSIFLGITWHSDPNLHSWIWVDTAVDFLQASSHRAWFGRAQTHSMVKQHLPIGMFDAKPVFNGGGSDYVTLHSRSVRIVSPRISYFSS